MATTAGFRARTVITGISRRGRLSTSTLTVDESKATAASRPPVELAVALTGGIASMPTIALWIITISSDQPIQDMAARLSDEGLSIKDILEEIGCITGSADDATAERLKHVQGVVDIAPDMQLDIGPPNVDETW